MNIVHISNTRGYNELDLPHGEMLICTGGVGKVGTDDEIIQFLNWFESRPHFYKIFVAGAEDWALDRFNCPGAKLNVKVADALKNFMQDNTHHYLLNSSVEIEGIKFWGSPFAFSHYPQAFSLESYADAKRCWSKIPNDTDVLLTPEAPFGSCDWTNEQHHGGCIELARKVEDVAPRLHLFGGFLLSRGVRITDNTTFVNSASYDPVTDKYRPARSIYYHNNSGKVTVFKEGRSTYQF